MEFTYWVYLVKNAVMMVEPQFKIIYMTNKENMKKKFCSTKNPNIAS